MARRKKFNPVVIHRQGGHFLKEGKTGRSILRLPTTGSYFYKFKRGRL